MAYQHARRPGAGPTAPQRPDAAVPGKRTLTQSLPPVQAKRGDPAKPGDPASTVDPGSLRASGSGAPLPEPVRVRMEALFGTHFSDVRVHAGEQAASIGARAYTRGSNIHFAPGAYQAESASGQELLGHELAHVVQQRAGRVSTPEATGAPINADTALEAEADAAGARVARGEPAGLSGGSGAAQAEGPIQRAVGFEFEMLSWSSGYTDEPPGPIGKGVHITDAPGFSMEGEDHEHGSTIEFVVKPLDSAEQVENVVGAAAKMATELIDQETPGEEIENGRPVLIDGRRPPNAGVHASPAVALSNIPALAQALDDSGMVVRGASMMPALKLVDRNREQIAQTLGEDPSEALRGLLTLTVYYLQRGCRTGRSSFPKELLPVMARTTFTKMLALVPEHGFFSKPDNAAVWVKLVLSTFAPEHDPEEVGQMPVFSQHFKALPPLPGKEDETDQHRLDTTRNEWLSNMPERDLLSRGEDERFEGMGAYGGATDTTRIVDEVSEQTVKALVPLLRSSMEKGGKGEGKGKGKVEQPARETTKLVGEQISPSYEDDELPESSTEAPLFELRQTGGGIDHPKDWVPRALQVFTLIDEVNQRQSYRARPPGPKKERTKNYNAPFVVDNTAPIGGIDRTVPQQPLEEVSDDPQGGAPDDEVCCCCWPFSWFCRC